MNKKTKSDVEVMLQRARAVHVRSRSLGKFDIRLPRLILVTDEVRLPNPIAAAQRMPRGSGVLFRHYSYFDRENLAGDLAVICRKQGLMLWVSSNVDLAKQVGAQGVHFPEYLAQRYRPPVPRNMVVSISAHSFAGIQRAEAVSADVVFVSPIFSTTSHPNQRSIGPWLFRTWASQTNLPLYALGGINQANSSTLAGSGGAGIAAITSLCGNQT